MRGADAEDAEDLTGNGWDPADATSGNGWENQALFGYDDKALSSMTWFSHR